MVTVTSLRARLENRTATVGVVGLGYVGLPLALAFAQAGLKTLGIDVQRSRVDMVNCGESYIADVPPLSLAASLSSGLLEATVDQDRLTEADAICICVPTPLTKTKDPDLSYILHESEEISRRLRPAQLIVLESTTYPGTTRQVVLPVLEQSGLRPGADFWLAFSPERVDPGSKSHNIRNTPKLVGGMDVESTSLAVSLYQNVADRVVSLSGPEVAEMTKVFENVFRCVNIALVNELAQLCQCMGISVWEVIDAAATKPFGYMPFYPGPGVGGHCIPLDPYYLANKAREYDFHTRFIELAAEINEHMPYHVVSRIMEVLNSQGKSLKGSQILVLGVTYKKDVDDVRESPSLRLIELLAEQGAVVSYHDPYVSTIRLNGRHLLPVDLSKTHLLSVDCTVIGTDHSSYDFDEIARHSKVLFDTRAATRRLRHPNIVRLGEGRRQLEKQPCTA